jgi:ArsR family transcriptional regulator, arsenate/arsenite/antimonite-responsive transcriptional repressor / arsenate reductase (thioredoxin)
MVAPAFVRLAAHPVRWQLLTALAGSDYRVRELVEQVDEPQSLVSYHLRLLRDAGLVKATRSSFDRRDSYYRLDLDRCAAGLAESAQALHPALARPLSPSAAPPRPVAVLFVCTGNSARSPIAETLLRHHGGNALTVTSAGTRPRDHLHPHAVRVLRDAVGVDVSHQRPRHLDTVVGRRFDHVITLCDRAREASPAFAHRPRRAHWSVADPATADDGYQAFRRAAADIETRVRHLLPVLATDRSEVPR